MTWLIFSIWSYVKKTDTDFRESADTANSTKDEEWFAVIQQKEFRMTTPVLNHSTPWSRGNGWAGSIYRTTGIGIQIHDAGKVNESVQLCVDIGDICAPYAVWVSRREVSIQKVLQFSTEKSGNPATRKSAGMMWKRPSFRFMKTATRTTERQKSLVDSSVRMNHYRFLGRPAFSGFFDRFQNWTCVQRFWSPLQKGPLVFICVKWGSEHSGSSLIHKPQYEVISVVVFDLLQFPRMLMAFFRIFKASCESLSSRWSLTFSLRRSYHNTKWFQWKTEEPSG